MEYKLTVGLRHPSDKRYHIFGYNIFWFGSQFEKESPDYNLGSNHNILWLRLDMGDKKANVSLDNVAYIEPFEEGIWNRYTPRPGEDEPSKGTNAAKIPGHLR